MSSPLPPTRIRRAGAARGLAVCTVLIGAALCAAGCGAGFNASSQRVVPNSGSALIGGLRINGVVVVMDPATRDAEVVAAVANTGSGPDRLVSVTAGGSAATVRPATSTSPLDALPGIDVTVAGNTVIIPSGSAVSFGQPGRPSLRISDSSMVPGHFTRVEFGFAGVGQTSLNALVMPNTGLFDSYNLAPTASATPSQTASPGAGPTPSPRSRAGSNPSANPTGTLTATATTTFVRAAHPTGPREPRR